jgi:hypothetical protein
MHFFLQGMLFSDNGVSIYYFIIKELNMKSIVFIAFLAFAAASCQSPEKSTGSDSSTSPVIGDSALSAPSTTDTVAITPVDTIGTIPAGADTTKVK